MFVQYTDLGDGLRVRILMMIGQIVMLYMCQIVKAGRIIDIEM